MILRKPYAFLIKHFKLMHIILSICFFYLIYRTGLMIEFINNYIDTTTSVVGDNIVGTLFNIGVNLLPVLIIVFSSILLAVMTLKDKPRLFYIIIIIVELVIIILNFYARSVFSGMEETIIDMRTVKTLRDLLVYVIIAQSAFSVFSVVRGVGFDIKRFNFGNDLQELEISSTDNEEFEVAIDFDLNDKKRTGKRILRYIKYWIKEHQLIVTATLASVIILLITYVGINFASSNKTYSEGKNIRVNSFNISVNKSYILNRDIKGTNITGENAYLVVVDLNVSCNEKKPKSLTVGAIELNIAGDVYHHTTKYDYQLTDLGNVYNNQEIGKETQRYLFVYEIPAKTSSSKMKLGLRDTLRNETTYISLDLNRFSEKKVSESYSLNETIEFDESTLGKTRFKVNKYDIENKFTINYKYCSPRNKCLTSVEYLTPNLFNSNYDKALLRLDVDFVLDNEIASSNIQDFYGVVKTFVSIEYEIDGETKYQKIYLGSVKSSKVKQENIYYIEVYEEIKFADKIALIFTIRDREYKYKLK